MMAYLTAGSAAENILADVGEKVQKGAVQEFLSTLPEKALNLGLRIFLAAVFFLILFRKNTAALRFCRLFGLAERVQRSFRAAADYRRTIKRLMPRSSPSADRAYI